MKGNQATVKMQRLKYVLTDWVSGASAFAAFNVVRYFIMGYGTLAEFLLSPKLVIEEAGVPVLMLAVYWMSGYYNRPFERSRLQEMVTTMCSALLNALWIYMLMLINDQTGKRMVNYELIMWLVGLLFAVPYAGRLIVTQCMNRRFRQRSWQYRTVVIGNTPEARAEAARIVESVSRTSRSISGFVNIPGEEKYGAGVPVCSMAGLEAYCRDNQVDELLLMPRERAGGNVMETLHHLFALGLPIRILPDTLSLVTPSIRLNDIYGTPLVDLTSPVLSESSKNMKRLLDVACSLSVLVLLSPLLAAIAIWVKLDSNGPAFYSQERIGRMQRPFRIYKFRSMRTDAEDMGPRLSSENDPRVTKAGRVLRKYRLDELPQFWNVLRGDMSIVGPRPERAHYVERIVERAPYYTLVHQVRPGITSWGMVKYGYASDIDQMVERSRYDLIYLGNMSLSVDVKILIYTVKTVLTGKGM